MIERKDHWTKEEMEAVIRNDPDFNYSHSPDNTQANRRYVFNHFSGDLKEAYIYVLHYQLCKALIEGWNTNT